MDEIQKQKIEEMLQKKERYMQAGGPEAIAKQHEVGKLTARERVSLLLDQGSFQEHDLFVNNHVDDFYLGDEEAPTEGLITGTGKINDRQVCINSQDFTVLGGSLGLWHCKKMIKLARLALTSRTPLIMINDSGGVRPQEQHDGLSEGYGPIFNFHTIASGVIPQITLVMGPVGGGPCYGPGLTDVIIMTKGTSCMFIGGPPVVKAVMGEDVSPEELGGAQMHAEISGVADLVVDSDEDGLRLVRQLLSYLPSHNMEPPPYEDTGDDPDRCDDTLVDIVPSNFARPYDMHKVLERVVDNGVFFELKPDYAKNILTGFARLNGHSIGILASQPNVLGGAIDYKAAWKAARFVRFCDAFSIPIVHFIDTPAYLVGSKSEQEGIIRHGAKLLHAECEATVPILTLNIRKSYAGAALAMGSRALGVADFAAGWPWAEFSIFGVDAGMNIILRSSRVKEALANAEDPDQLMKQWRQEYTDKYIETYRVTPVRHLDTIIEPRETRPVLIKALESLRGKKKELPWKKHSNIPL